MFQNFYRKILRHKIVSGIIFLLLIIGGYYGYGKFFPTVAATRYVTATVEKGTLIVSVSGSGQVSVLNQVDLKAKTSGDIVYVGVKKGQEMKAGTFLAQIDTRDAKKTIRNAEIALESAKLELEKMKGLITEEGTIRGVKEKAQSDLQKAYDDGFNSVSNAFLDFPDIMTGLYNLLFDTTLDKIQWNVDYYVGAVKTYDEKVLQYRDDAKAKYQEAREKYNQAFSDYKAASRYSDNATIDSLVSETYETTKSIAEAVKSATNLIQFYKDKLIERNLKTNSLADTHLSTLNSYTSKTNSYLLSLLSVKNTILTDKENLVGTTFDISDQEIKVSQAENTLTEAKENLTNCYIYAPFDGIVAKVDVKKGDSVSGGAVATLITKQRTADISLNEVDVAQVKVGQKVTLTFDAIEGLSIAGEVAEIDTLGTVSQGVVNYAVKIVFDTQDERVKPGMSVSSAVITDIKQDVLVVPNSAVKSNGNGQYVEFLINNAPQSQSVEIGLSNDTMTEIKSGLKEGDKVITQTITANTTQTQTQSTGIRIPGIGGMR